HNRLVDTAAPPWPGADGWLRGPGPGLQTPSRAPCAGDRASPELLVFSTTWADSPAPSLGSFGKAVATASAAVSGPSAAGPGSTGPASASSWSPGSFGKTITAG